MSLNHICEGGRSDIDLDVKSLKIQGEPVGLKSLPLTEISYSALDLNGVGNVFLASGPSAVIEGVTGCNDGQSVKFMTCQQASSISFSNGGTIRTSTGSFVLLSGTGESAEGVWSDALGYLTVVKTS